MSLSAGTRLGPYEILAPLGAGGMGEVYRARDSKLDREVAVKVLPAHLTSNPDALARFEREAKAVAALSHPNILAIFDFGTHDGVSYAVTELLEGETLRGKLDGSTVTQRQAVDWCLQIAKGLSAAHGKGVVHRDLKPDNVFVSSDGHVKILDFGLAKRDRCGRPRDQTNAPTGTGHTEPGTVMGTMGYMSPEQVRGLPVDHRTDLFSFGAILYELLSGRKAFKRDTASDTIAAILKEEPPELVQSDATSSPALDHIVRHCLEKDRENRFQSAKDVAFALSEALGADDPLERAARRPSRLHRGVGRWSGSRRRPCCSCRQPDCSSGSVRRWAPPPPRRAYAASRCSPSRTSARPRTTISPTASPTRSAASSRACPASRSSPAAARRPTRRRRRRRRRSRRS